MLLENHRQEWLKSCVSTEIINRNVWSIEDPQEIDKLLNRNTDRRWKHTFNCAGWAVRGINPIDLSECWEGCQFKPDQPRVSADGKAIKYESIVETRIAPLFLDLDDRKYWLKVAQSNEPIIITEGAKKAGCGLSAGYPTISIPGVWNGQNKGRLHHFIKHFCNPGRRFYLAFDSDVLTKESVQKALFRLSRLLLEQSCNVSIVLFPDGEGDKTGLDDYCAANGLGALSGLLEQAKTFEEWANGVIDAQPKLTKRQQQIAKMEKIFGNRCKLLVRGNQILIDGKPHNADWGYLEIEKRYGIGAGQDFFNQCLQWIASQNPYDPVRDWLEELYDKYGSTTIDMVEGMATKYLGTNHPLYDTYLKKVLLAAIDRVFNPGCKFETACVLQGGQGIGKSSFWRVLAGEWFDDTMKDTSNDELMKLHTCWIEEWGEIDRVTGRKEANEIKQFLSVQTDKFRPPYGRQVVENPRRFIIVGSTNSGEFLQDSTGDRRFWVIPVPGKINLELLKHDVERLWAGAYALWLTGTEKTYLTPGEEALREEFNAPYRSEDPWEEVIGEYLGTKEEVKVNEILTKCLGLTFDRCDRRAQLRVSSILRALGWEKSHSRKGKIWRLKKDKKLESHGSQPEKTYNYSGFERDLSPIGDRSQNNGLGHLNPPCDLVTPVTHKIDENKKLTKGNKVRIVDPIAVKQFLVNQPWWERPPEDLLSDHWTIFDEKSDGSLILMLDRGRIWTITAPPHALVYVANQLGLWDHPADNGEGIE